MESTYSAGKPVSAASTVSATELSAFKLIPEHVGSCDPACSQSLAQTSPVEAEWQPCSIKYSLYAARMLQSAKSTAHVHTSLLASEKCKRTSTGHECPTRGGPLRTRTPEKVVSLRGAYTFQARPDERARRVPYCDADFSWVYK